MSQARDERRAAPSRPAIPPGAEPGREQSSGLFVPGEGLGQLAQRGLQGRVAYPPHEGPMTFDRARWPQAQGLATPVAWRMLRVGESSGEVPAMLQRAAAFHDAQIARFSDLVTRLVNPLLMLVMGVVIGGIVVLMYLPIFTLMEQVQ